MPSNRLSSEKSPYLLQHAGNPINWYPWCEEAFSRANMENRPIFLSIGYSTCHWCHVMAHESFEDEEVARLMNETFVCIKVDREERPDIDGIYMAAAQMISGNTGWPLNVILTPERSPFYAATYIPKGGRPGMMGMLELVPRIAEVWLRQRDRVMETGRKVAEAMQSGSLGEAEGFPGKELCGDAYRELSERYDEVNGGFGTSPKFPTPHNLLFLLRYSTRTEEARALTMVEETLTRIRDGGVYDQLGFGFHRYSVDSRWLIPHYEKMLYDQALTATAYLEVYQATGNDRYADTAREIFTYILRDMTAAEGGFYSGEDADSEGREGRFYLWTDEEVRSVLNKEDAELFEAVYGIERYGNFSEPGLGVKTMENILHRKRPLSEIASSFGIGEGELRKRVESARRTLLEARCRRVRPHKDDKILTDWNGLMIAALARGGRVLDEPLYTAAARRCAGFIMKEMRRDDGRLYHRHRDGESAIEGFLDDYAFLVWGLLELYEATFETPFLKTAVELAGETISHFMDDRDGGFFFSADDGERLMARRKEVYDGAIPSGNSVMMMNLLRLGRMTGDQRYEQIAREAGRAFFNTVRQFPSGYSYYMAAVELSVGRSIDVTISGARDSDETAGMVRALYIPYLPHMTIVFRDPGEVIDVAPHTRTQLPVDGRATAYICVDRACMPPVCNTDELNKIIAPFHHKGNEERPKT